MKTTQIRNKKAIRTTVMEAADILNKDTSVEAASSMSQASSTSNIDRDAHTAYYSALVGAWINTKMEKDKSLLTLSTGGIGLLTTLLTTVGTKSPVIAVFYGLGFLFFLTSIITALAVLGQNAKLIETLINSEKPSERFISFLDKTMFWSFVFGLLATIVIGLWGGTSLFNVSGGLP